MEELKDLLINNETGNDMGVDMKEKLREIIDKHLEGNYLLGDGKREEMLSELMELVDTKWVAFEDAYFLKDGQDYLICDMGIVTVDTWFNDSFGFLHHSDDVMVAELPEPPCSA